MSSLLGLAGYQGDSEISDSEGEASPTVDRGPQPPGVGENDTPPLQAVLTCLSTVSSGLGIPRSVVQQEVPATEPFVRPVVQSAPSIGLVAYYHDDEEGLGEDEENMVSGHHISVCVCVTRPLSQDTGVLLIPQQQHKVATQGSSSPTAVTIGSSRQQLETVSDTELSLGEEEGAESPDVTITEGKYSTSCSCLAVSVCAIGHFLPLTGITLPHPQAPSAEC